MATLQDLKSKLDQLRETLQSRAVDISATMAISAKALAERNIKEKGFGSTYSENKVPAFFFFGRELNNQGKLFLESKGVNSEGKQEKKEKKKRKKKGESTSETEDNLTNWKEFREAQGLQGTHVDLTYTGKMWASMQPVNTITKGTSIVTVLGSTNTEDQNKMNWNRARYGDFIKEGLTDDSKKILVDLAFEEIEKLILEFGFKK